MIIYLKETSFRGYFYGFSLDHYQIEEGKIQKIHKYLTKKQNI